MNDEDIASGNHTITVEVDPFNLVSESDETNNNMSIEIYVRSSVNRDIAVENISLNKTEIFHGDFVDISAIIANRGTEEISQLKVMFVVNDTKTREVLEETTINLPAGDSLTVNTTWKATIGNHTITVIVDPENIVREYDEANNQNSTSVFVSAPYDFSIKSLNVDDITIFSGESITINASLKIKANRSGNVEVCLYCDRELQHVKYVNFGAGDMTRNETFVWRAGGVGNHNLNVSIDPFNNFTESDETNNNRSVMMLSPKKIKRGKFFFHVSL